MWWWIVLGAVGFLILLIIFNQTRKIFKKRSNKPAKQEIKKIEPENEVKKEKKKFNSKLSFGNGEEKNIEATIEENPIQEEKEEENYVYGNNQRRVRRPFPMPEPPQQEDDFDEFRRKHSYSQFLGNNSILEQIKGLSPELKAILFGNVLDRKD